MKKFIFFALWLFVTFSCFSGGAQPQVDPVHIAKIESLRERAKNGDVSAMHLLVEMVTEMAPRYEKEAEYWLRRAVELGDKDAPRMLAEMLLLRNDETGFQEAIALLKKNKPGDVGLAGRIGNAYADRAHAEESIGWLQTAASQGDFDSAVELSDMYAEVARLKSVELSTFWACKAITLRSDHSFMANKLRERVKVSGMVCP